MFVAAAGRSRAPRHPRPANSLGFPLFCALAQKKDFPTNLEPLLFGRTLNIPDGAERKAAVLKLVMQQLLECLQAVHAAGAAA